jgi:hypothetical protein
LHDGQSSHARHAQIARRANVSQPRIVASSGKSAASSARLALNEGRIAIVTNVDAGCDGRKVPSAIHAQTSGALRTAKSCGPGLPTLRLSWRMSIR